ncbi:MAG: hypothetical protein QF890_17775 [Myxococcota bacterium]|nr:hypothetical protein [Deltaproteobacteria bacterium]MCP4241673.1 hypothetical protein [bacterium]MDP6075170.1 hypothetical protein [Myxococcota bacterium]MDP7075911.1 hypothetical protein [Myxococcota bacterium]MDP7298291.1 hypothetical protein [Myxococcota bacterium]
MIADWTRHFFFGHYLTFLSWKALNRLLRETRPAANRKAAVACIRSEAARHRQADAGRHVVDPPSAAAGDDLLILSYRLGPGLGRLVVTQLGDDYTPGTATTYSDAGSVHKFPTGNLWEAPFLFVAYTKHDDTLADTDPYFPYIRALGPNLQDIDDFRVGEGDGFGGVHPTMVRSGDKVYVAWSRVGAQTGSMAIPQVRLEVYAFDSGVSAVPGAVPWVRVTLVGVLLAFGLRWLRSVRGAIEV